jgi:hypothetical protein
MSQKLSEYYRIFSNEKLELMNNLAKAGFLVDFTLHDGLRYPFNH